MWLTCQMDHKAFVPTAMPTFQCATQTAHCCSLQVLEQCRMELSIWDICLAGGQTAEIPAYVSSPLRSLDSATLAHIMNNGGPLFLSGDAMGMGLPLLRPSPTRPRPYGAADGSASPRQPVHVPNGHPTSAVEQPARFRPPTQAALVRALCTVHPLSECSSSCRIPV